MSPPLLPKHSRNQTLFNWLRAPASGSAPSPSVMVMGGGASGIAAFDLLKSLGLAVFGADDRGTLAHPEFRMASDVVDDKTGEFSATTRCDLMVLSPGVSLAHPVVQLALRNGVPVISEVELGLAFLEDSAHVVGVTGTNGKSTVTHCLAALFSEHLQTPCAALGNIGTSVCRYVLGQERAPAYVIELSSYQLETMFTHSLDAAVFTNFSSDHLARYGDLEGYFRAKWRLTGLLKHGAPLALSSEVAECALRFGCCLGRSSGLTIIDSAESTNSTLTLKTSPHPSPRPSHTMLKGFEAGDLRLPVAGYALQRVEPLALLKHSPVTSLRYECLNSSHFVFEVTEKGKDTESGIHNRTELRHSILQGKHNAENLSYCRFIELVFFGSVPSKIPSLFSASSSGFQNLPHRQEPVKVPPSAGIQVINDSKSTSFICTARALACFPSGTHLLLGGQLKDKNVGAILPEDPSVRLDLRGVYTFGPDAPWLAEQAQKLLGVAAVPFESVALATHAALQAARPGETVLLSPGAASFDSFRGFEDRGQHFKLEVQRYFENFRE